MRSLLWMSRCAYVEHCAANDLDPPGNGNNLDFAGSEAGVRSAVLSTPFSLISSSHRELLFESRDALLIFLGRVKTEFNSRVHRVSKSEARDCVRSRYTSADGEWRVASLCSNQTSVAQVRSRVGVMRG